MTNPRIEAKNERYGNRRYENLPRFVSYYNQIDLVRALDPKEILEVGIGSGFLSNYLRSRDYAVTTADYDKTLGPDIVCDIRNIPLEDGSFELVMAFEILEHVPYEEALNGIKEMGRISSRYVVLSVPRSCFYFGLSFMFGLPTFHKFMSLGLRLPFFWVSAEYGSKEHFWELGRRGFPIRRLVKDIQELGLVLKQRKGHIALNTQHYFFVLEKTQRS